MATLIGSPAWRTFVKADATDRAPRSSEIVPHPRHAQNVYDGVVSKPEYHVVANLAPEGCRDPAGFDRAAFHREFNSAVVAFFKAKLHA